ncbi:membrane protein [Kineosporia sp. NBRC 101677]|uniref:anthrone oxygenase family protein n=1 Tax=Kineosporia sp. NBRC 101677 TaxID=3032197 RepID=UPI0024A577EB|nr:anthrone oxygenase family protein [Kineosporia sp. NBRC 101677]GLY18772.1 membrane protein [Kineosporia sp. NBRC 101677]
MSELSRTSELVVVFTAVGCGLVAGVLFAFSGFVMAGLNRVAPGQAVAAMQGINVTALRPPLMIAVFATGAGAVAVAVIALRSTEGSLRALLLAGAALYLLGGVGVTGAFNVPMNNALDALNPSSADIAQHWQHYLTRWTAWNHVRTAACLTAALSLTLGLTKAA